jgi:hypothetical protein
MSVRTMSLVFEYDMPELKTDDGKTVPDSTAKFVLLALADHCNDEGEGAYPGVKRICKKTSMSTQTVCNALNALRHNEYTNLEGKSKANTNNYTLNLDKLQRLELQPIESPDSSHQNPPILATEVKPSFNHEIKPSRKKGDLVDGILFFAGQAKDQQADKVEELIQELERGLRVNITRTTKAQQTARKILRDARPVARFLSWVVADEWRSAHLYLYADLDKVWRDWPQAFPAVNQNPDGKRASSFYG